MAEEEEDLNAFNIWDSVGATIMLGVVPAALCYVFNDHDYISSGLCMGASLLAGCIVYLAGLLMPGRLLGRIVNLAGCLLAPIYLIIAILMWQEAVKEDIPSTQDLPTQKQ